MAGPTEKNLEIGFQEKDIKFNFIKINKIKMCNEHQMFNARKSLVVNAH